MQVSNIYSAEHRYQAAGNSRASEETVYVGAVTEAASEDEGIFLGLTMIPEEGSSVVYGMRAMLSEESTPDKPIVQIISNLDGKKEVYNIDISQVDPQNATRMEMFALCSYEDKYGTGTGSTFGSFKTLQIYEETAKQNGCTKQIDVSISAWEQFRTEKVDWVEQTEMVCNILKECADAKALDLFSKGKKLLTMYERYSDTAAQTEISSQYLNVTECSVCSFPDSGISFYYNHSTGVLECVDDTNNQPGRQILWSKQLSEEAYDSCEPLFERQKGERNWTYKYEAYLAHEDFWDMYLNHEFDIEAFRNADMLLTDNSLFDQLFENSPKSVRTAWENALMTVGSVFSKNTDGNVTYFSELYKQIFLNTIAGKDFAVLGTTVESAVEYAQKAIENLSSPMGHNNAVNRMRDKERQFYNEFLNNLL